MSYLQKRGDFKMLTISEAQKMFRVYPRTRKLYPIWEMANIMNIPHNIKQAAQGIAYARATGRLTGSAEMAIRGMTSYQQLQLLVKVVNKTNTQAEVPGFLNEYFSEV